MDMNIHMQEKGNGFKVEIRDHRTSYPKFVTLQLKVNESHGNAKMNFFLDSMEDIIKLRDAIDKALEPHTSRGGPS